MFLVRCVWFMPALVALATGCGGGGTTNASPLPRPAGSGSSGARPGAVGPPQGPKGTVTRDLDAGASDPNVAYSATMTMTGFTVPAGAEVYKCQDFADPFGAGPVDIKAWQVDMSRGS